MNGRAAARSGEWAQHFSNASCSLCGGFEGVENRPSPLAFTTAWLTVVQAVIMVTRGANTWSLSCGEFQPSGRYTNAE